MQKIPWYQKIQIQIPVIVFLIILIPAAAFGSYDISASRQAQLKAAKTQAAERLYEASLLMQDVMQELESAGKTLSENREFLELLKKYLGSPGESKFKSGLLLALGQSSWPNSYIEHMYLVSDNPPSILSSDPDEKFPDTNETGHLLYQTWQNSMQGQTTWSLLPASENGRNQRCQRTVHLLKFPLQEAHDCRPDRQRRCRSLRRSCNSPGIFFCAACCRFHPDFHGCTERNESNPCRHHGIHRTWSKFCRRNGSRL